MNDSLFSLSLSLPLSFIFDVIRVESFPISFLLLLLFDVISSAPLLSFNAARDILCVIYEIYDKEVGCGFGRRHNPR
jgi:hypothetical protein